MGDRTTRFITNRQKNMISDISPLRKDRRKRRRCLIFMYIYESEIIYIDQKSDTSQTKSDK